DICIFGDFGAPSDVPVAGDWNGDGKFSVGVKRGSTWFLDANGNNQWDNCQQDGGQDICIFGDFGAPSDVPVAGRW
ncbi:MAG: hypothetical protein V2J55_07740, partial [Candidatus Competibacteraceae bacterium]|nr:hypothetical protein [Candidatus Competibacteraceae bacterium]